MNTVRTFAEAAALCQWTDAERRMFTVASRVRPSVWATENRYLTPWESAEPGRWRNERTPYLVGIMDAAADQRFQKVIVMKSTQIGYSECCRNVLGYWIDVDPGPCLFVMPDELSGKAAIDERIKPLMQNSPAIARHATGRQWDVKRSSIKLDTMSIYVGWSGSPQSLAGRPCRYIWGDEVDKWAQYAGREADPVSLAIERTRTFTRRKKIFLGSSPTTSDGYINQLYQACGDKRHYQCPCPLCGAYQQLTFAQVKWPKDLPGEDREKSERIKDGDMAWYECAACAGRIEHKHKPAMLAAGQWVSDGITLDKAGNASGRPPASTDVGFHINALYSPWIKWSEVVAMFLASKDDPATLQNFRNSWMAEPFEIQIAKPTIESFRTKSEPANCGPAGIVPEWASVLYATADVQIDHFWYCIRAWGYGLRSQLVHNGMCFTWDELYRLCLGSVFPVAARNTTARCPVLVIDSGARTDEVYEFAHKYAPQIIPIKGSATRMEMPFRVSYLPERPGMRAVELRTINTEFFKDQLARLIADPDAKRWQLHDQIADDYVRQLASEHKILDRKTGLARWEPITSGAPNHAWDLEVYQCAAAHWGGVAYVPPAIQQPKPNNPQLQRPPEKRTAFSGGDDFLPKTTSRGSGWLDG